MAQCTSTYVELTDGLPYEVIAKLCSTVVEPP